MSRFMPSTETYIERRDENTMIINMGPQHPSTHGVLRVVLEIDGETIVKAVCYIGFLHTGIEKEGEYQTYLKCVPMTDRMDYLSANHNNLMHALSVEKLMGVEIPPRGQYLRVILAELSRINSHLVWLGTHALDLGAMTPFFWAFIEREKTLDLFQMMSGQRMMPSWIVPGGLRGDMPEGWEQKLRDFIAVFPGALAEVESLLVTNPIWLERTQGVGVLSLKDCLRYGVSGPIIRASGLAWDIRKSNPYSSYDKFDFEIPVGKHGDVYDRFLVRLEEMRQSIRIITQAIDNLPDGPISSSDRKVVPPPREELDTSMEAIIHHFLLWTEGYHPPPGEVYVPTESPKGEAGFYIVSDGADAPYRWHLRPPSFMNLQVLDLMCRGGLMADMVACIGSIDIVLGEVDR